MIKQNDHPVVVEDSPAVCKEHKFIGHHLFATYSKCNEAALKNLNGLAYAMEQAVKASGATFLRSVKHVFPNGGFTMLILLSESHASIHTYPEYNACFVDIFTCGTFCLVEKFDLAMQDYLRPEETHQRISLRGKTVVDEIDETFKNHTA